MDIKKALLFASGLTAGYLLLRGRTGAALAADILSVLQKAGYTGSQLASVAAIISTAIEEGFTDWRLHVGMVANAIAESGLNPSAIGDGGHSVGLFQLNDRSAGAPWKGLSVEERSDPVTNTRYILRDNAVSYVVSLLSRPGYTASDAAWDWCYYVERPADKQGDADRRKALVQSWGLA